MRSRFKHALAALALLAAPPAFADGRGDAGPDVAAPPAAPAQTQAQTSGAEGRSGAIAFDQIALNVPDGYRFYPASEAYAFLQRNGAAAPSGAVLGLIAQVDTDVRAPGAWATVLSFDAIGFVQPETAAGLSASTFENDVRAARSQQNRAFEGFAAAPVFTAETPKLVWAERTAAPGSQGADLRHEQKVLGRFGVAGLTSIGSADQMPAMEAAAAELQAMLAFPEGARHADFQAASDRVSAYSVPGLATGVPTPSVAAPAAAPAAEGQTGFAGLSGMFPWIAAGIVVLAIVGYLLMRRRRAHPVEA